MRYLSPSLLCKQERVLTKDSLINLIPLEQNLNSNKIIYEKHGKTEEGRWVALNEKW